jgi:pimeloyl-ACP methyl ester carboxylesterase
MKVSVQTIDLNTEIVGTGRPVILLHGWGGSVKSWGQVPSKLAASGFQVHTMDLPGFGSSSVPPKPWTVSDYANLVVEYARLKDLSQVDIIGHSFGGRIGIVIASDYPDLVRKLVLVNSAGVKPDPGAMGIILRGLSKIVRPVRDLPVIRGLRVRFYRHIGAQDYLTAGPLQETLSLVLDEDLRDKAAQIKCPTLLIWGDQDNATPLWQAEELKNLIPDSGLVVFKGAGHFSYLDKPFDFLQIVNSLLES